MRQVLRILLLLGLALGLTVASWTLFSACRGVDLHLPANSTCRFVYDYQSLVAGGLALLAALVALLPVYDQVGLARVQSAIMTRQILGRRVLETEARQHAAKQSLAAITTAFLQAIYPGDPDGEAEIDVNWAFGAWQLTDQTVRDLSREQTTRMDPKSVNTARALVLEAARKLAGCLDDIHEPHSRDYDDPELGLTDEQAKAAEADALRASKAAETELPRLISSTRKASDGLDGAYISVIDAIRRRIRDLDDFILAKRH